MALPLREMRINPEESSDVEVSFVALVPNPAIEINFMMFNDQRLQFAVDPDKRIISGPAMTPNVPIYRKDASGEYNVFFSADTIKHIALKFSKKGYGKNLNLFHDPTMPADGVAIFNSFVSDKSIGIMPQKGYENTPDGTWFISAKVESEDIWQRIKAGEFKGFSVEGNFSFVENEQSGEKLHLIEKGFMSDLKEMVANLKAFFLKTEMNASGETTSSLEAITAKLKDGTEITVTELANGGVVMTGAAPIAAGEYELEDGTKLVVAEGGVITTITPVAAAAPPPPPDFTAQFAEINGKFAGYEQKFAAYETKFQEQAQAIAAATAMNTKLFAIVEKLAETPTANPTSGSGSLFASQASKDRDDRLREISANLKKLKTA